MKKLLIPIIAFIYFQPIYAQVNELIDINLNWNDKKTESTIPSFEQEEYIFDYQQWPVFSTSISLNTSGEVNATIVNPTYKELRLSRDINIDKIDNVIHINTRVQKGRSGYKAIFHFTPFIKSRGKILKLVSGQIKINFTPKHTISFRNEYKDNSILSRGDIYKFRISNTGIHKMDKAFLKTLGVSIGNIHPDKIHIYGHLGGALPQPLKTERTDDLEELSIKIIGGNDGVFNEEDYILFYGMGSEKIRYEKNNNNYLYRIDKNIYDDSSYYFLIINDDIPKRIIDQPSLQSASYESTSFGTYEHFEEDLYNLLGRSRRNEGSGKLWVGREFTNSRNKDYSTDFSLSILDKTKKAHFEASFIARSSSSSRIKYTIDNNIYTSNISSVNISDVESTYARIVNTSESFTPESLKINVNYNETTTLSEGWLDYITINYNLYYDAQKIGQKIIRDAEALNHATSFFNLKNSSLKTQVWDISDPLNPISVQANLNQNNLKIGYESSSLKSFVCFDLTAEPYTPGIVGKFKNQNLHAIMDAEEIIVYHKSFEEQAIKLTQHRINHSNLNAKMVRIDHIMNEFSSGKTDPTALRDFVKMIHDRDSSNFKYLALIGDGSYDYLHKVKNTDNQNFIPVYETNESLNPILAYPSDDYYALLDNDEGRTLKGGLDISVGRILSKTPEEANIIIDRIIDYETSPEELKDWRNQMLFMADDEDSNLHVGDVDRLSRDAIKDHPVYNHQKIYLDAYEQVSTPGGERYPAVTKAIDQSIFKGVFSFTYLGHGGPTGFAQERILQINDILNWSNKEKVPIFLTATCSFTPYDDSEITSAGEHCVLHPKGGIVALLSTVRAVYASSNERLTRNVLKKLFLKNNNKRPKIGDVIIDAKNESGASFENNRKFSLFGDPAMDVMLPLFKVETDEINGQDITTFKDTLHALDKVTIKGSIKGYNNELLTDFNGILYPTIFDKSITLKTKANDSRSQVFPFDVQKNILYKGSVSIKSGVFEFTFNIPKDINYNIGKGKISYYASDLVSRDANGYYDSLYIGGANQDDISDDEGPIIEVFMNSFDFVSGGITGQDPTLLVRLSDDIGINVSGTSIGHDLTGILDGDKNNKFILNEHYEAEIDDYTKGTIRFPLKDLEPGIHHLKIIAWDIANNSAEGFTEFIVETDAKIALKRVLNYPNPFINLTNFQFEHNLADAQLNIVIRIFTVSGRLVKTIDVSRTPQGNLINDISWDGNDDYGNNLGKGVYIYKINVSSDVIGGLGTRKTESDFEKLVILK